VPINDRSGKHVAELVATGNRPCVIGLRGWTQGAMTRFWIDFAETLFARNAGELYLVVDEFHNFAPKGKILSPQAGKALHWSNRLLSEGRGLGIVCLTASQRPQKVHNDSLTSCETLVAMRVIHKADRDAVKDWIDGNGDPAGQGGAQHAGGHAARGGVGLVAGDRVRAQAGEVPDVHHVRLVRAAAAAEAGERQGVGGRGPVGGEGEAGGGDRGGEGERPEGAALSELLHQSAKELGEAACGGPGGEPGDGEKAVARPGAVAPARPAPLPAVRASQATRLNGEGASCPRFVAPADAEGREALQGPERKLLDALAWLEQIGVTEPENGAAAFVAGYSPTSTSYTNPRGALRSKGMIEYLGDDRLRLTSNGRGLAAVPEKSPSTGELHERILGKLDGPMARLLRPLLERYPNAMSNEDLAAAAGYSPTSTSYTNPRGALRSFGMVEYRDGGVAARSILFPTADHADEED
jgi:hypothetical protein